MLYIIPRHIKWIRLLAVLVLAWYFVTTALEPYAFSIIGTFNLVMHEAGHWIFGIFGEVIGLLGGSLMQVMVPLVSLYAFWRQVEYLGMTFSMLWLGQSLIEVAAYIGDAIIMQLPLLGGETVVHDWNWLLSYYGVLEHTATIAGATALVGWALIFLGISFGVRNSLKKERMQKPVQAGK